jgi:TfoX/Sxy family transcriptional regulator of competence genes
MRDRILRWASDKEFLEMRHIFGVDNFLHLGNFLAANDGGELIVRLSEADEKEALKIPGSRPWRSGAVGTNVYTLIPASAVAQEAELNAWLDRALEHVKGLEPKERLVNKSVIRPDFLGPA